MSAHHLEFSSDIPVQILPLQEKVEIEVPAGESHYSIQAPEGVSGTYIFHLRHPDSKLLLTGLIKTIGDSQPQLRTEVIHHAPHTYAESIIRTLAHDSSAPHYEGLIRIEKEAQESESYLGHYSLLLGEQSHSWALPSLEILANNVKCSHAATVQTIDELQLFYPRTRGLSPDEAREVLIEAFVADVVQTVE